MSLNISYQDHVGLWRDELQEWMPERIYDAHIHMGLAEAMGPISEKRRHAVTSFTHLPWHYLKPFYQDLYSGKQVEGLIAFPFPLHEVNYEMANRYIANLVREEPRITGFILSNPFDTGSTIEQFKAAEKRGVRFRGVKPYYDLLGRDITNSVEVADTEDFVPDDLLEWMNSEHLILMLHTCSIGMGDAGCQRWVRRVTDKYPNIKIILAHMGRYFEKEQFFDFFDSGLMDLPMLFLETSDARVCDVYASMLTRPDWCRRLVFGSDLPYGLFMGDPVDSYDGIRVGRTYNTYHVIQAIKNALESTTWDEEEKERIKADIFFHNATERLLATTG